MLLDLTSEYMRFMGEQSLRQRKLNLEEMYMLLRPSAVQASSAEDHNVKTRAREIYQSVFSPMLDIVIAADPKKPEKMMAALTQSLQGSG
jgi:ABC-type phosphate transport system auxiliary subunit